MLSISFQRLPDLSIRHSGSLVAYARTYSPIVTSPLANPETCRARLISALTWFCCLSLLHLPGALFPADTFAIGIFRWSHRHMRINLAGGNVAWPRAGCTVRRSRAVFHQVGGADCWPQHMWAVVAVQCGDLFTSCQQTRLPRQLPPPRCTNNMD